jgi:lipopolysaccharide transport system ATP-binding protein
MSTPAIRLEKIGKQYRLGPREHYKALRDVLTDAVASPFRRLGRVLTNRQNGNAPSSEMFWALKDISVEINSGDVVGLIGQNGSGKSTLLKILSRITEPTEGYAEVRGRVGSLLEVGTGFHPELTGRENIYLSGAILGMKKKEITRHFDEIVAFAEVEQFLDTPVKHYSSGMYVRLAFSVAAHMETEVLLVDEVLAVGDVAFQKKCLGKISQVNRSGRTVVFVSHNLASVENLCSTGIVLERGEIAFSGTSKQAVQHYLERLAEREPHVDGAWEDCRWVDPLHRKYRSQDEAITYTRIEFRNQDGERVRFVRAGEPVVVRLHYHAHKDVRRPYFGLTISTELGTVLAHVDTWLSGFEIPVLSHGHGHIDLHLDSLNLSPARYFLSAVIAATGPIFYDSLDRCTVLTVEDADFYGSGRRNPQESAIMLLPCKWRHREGHELKGTQKVQVEEGSMPASKSAFPI